MKVKKYYVVLLSLVVLTVLLNLLGFSKTFCNFYTDHIYGGVHFVFGILSTWIPFALGEIIMYAGAVAVVLLAVFGVICIFLRKKKGYCAFFRRYAKTILMTLVIFLFIYTTNWFIPFRADVLKVSDNERTVFTYEEINQVHLMIVQNLNELSKEVKRDENGNILFDYSEEEIIEALQKAGDDYSRLKGFYPHSKKAICSSFLEWMGIGGYNYIYTMEPTYNSYCDQLYMPVLLAHEYTHNKGYYKENEAEFLSCIALINSDNPYLRYCGYFEMYDYIFWDYYRAAADRFDKLYPRSDFMDADAMLEYDALWQQYFAGYPDEQVSIDQDYARGLAAAIYEEQVNPVLEETFSEVTAEVATKGWEIQEEVLQENSYDGLSLMLLQYYIE